MKEGRLSSALQERYGIGNVVGKVLWHSLNENGEIGVYDMKFGNTIVRNLLSEDIKPENINEHTHSPRREDDPDRVDEDISTLVDLANDPETMKMLAQAFVKLAKNMAPVAGGAGLIALAQKVLSQPAPQEDPEG